MLYVLFVCVMWWMVCVCVCVLCYSTNVPIALYSLLNVAPDHGLIIVRNMCNQLTKK